MRMLRIEVVVRTVDVGGHHRGEHRLVLRSILVDTLQLIVVRVVQNVDHTLRVRVAEVRRMRRAVVHHELGDRVGGLVREDAGGQAGDALLHLVLERRTEYVVVHLTVQSKEVQIVRHVAEQTAHFGAQVNHVRRLELLENGVHLLEVRQIRIARADELELIAGVFCVRLLYAVDRTADQTGTTGD